MDWVVSHSAMARGEYLRKLIRLETAGMERGGCFCLAPAGCCCSAKHHTCTVLLPITLASSAELL